MKTINKNQENIIEALKVQINRNHNNNERQTFQNLMLKINELRALGSSHALHLQWFRSNWSRLKLPPLFAEIFDIPKASSFANNNNNNNSLQPPQMVNTTTGHLGQQSLATGQISQAPVGGIKQEIEDNWVKDTPSPPHSTTTTLPHTEFRSNSSLSRVQLFFLLVTMVLYIFCIIFLLLSDLPADYSAVLTDGVTVRPTNATTILEDCSIV